MAQLYKSTLPDGRVIYADKPVPGAKKVEEIQPPLPPSPAELEAAQARRQRALEQAEQTAQRLRAVAEQRAAAEEEVRQAEAALERAQQAREAGRTPLPGELVGTVGGGVRLSEAYQARQRALEREVSAARERLERARQALNALR